MADAETQKAVIYCRVSHQRQVTEGHGLTSQETRCREYAKHKGYDCVHAYHEEGVTGKLMDRPQMQVMLAFLKKNTKKSKQPYIVIIDDISRLARNIEAHIKLRSAINDAGGKLESPSIEFGEDSDSRLVEHLLASVAAHQREKNAEQVTNRMRARALNGYWVASPVPGYRYETVAGHGKLLVRNEPVATIVQEAMEGFAYGRFETQVEVRRFLESHEAFPRGRNGKIHLQRVKDILTRVLYAGYISFPNWGIHLHPGKHEALISFETWQKIQERLNKQAKAPVRKDINDDFPLRGFVSCGCCDQPMTACWSKGRNRSYPYYLCQTKGCEHRGKSIRREKMESEFDELLKTLRPSPDLFHMAKAMWRELWNDRQHYAEQEVIAIEGEKNNIERQVQILLDRIMEADSSALIATYEARINDLTYKKTGLNEKIAGCGRALPDFDDTFRTAFEFLANPHGLWLSEKLEDKRTALRLAFADKLQYDRNKGYRTASIALPFRVLEGVRGGEYEMVGPVGLEPTTKGL